MSAYVGRFAPSPSGPLHFGSLVTAVFSYLHAKQNNGKWLIRIEDLDVPRSIPGADKDIIDTLLIHGMVSDDEVVYQSSRSNYYENTLLNLSVQSYFCTCTRAQIKAMGGTYNGLCKHLIRPSQHAAIRFIHDHPQEKFHDLLHGDVLVTDTHAKEDFVIKRKDGLFAYHLAVVCDDIEQQVTHIVRGSDLIDTTCSHLALYKALGQNPPNYMHLPVICSTRGKKLSKQNHAPAIDNTLATKNLVKAFNVMGFKTPLELEALSVSSIMAWAIEHVNISNLPQKLEMIVPIA